MVLCFGLAAGLDRWFQGWQGNRLKSADILSVLLGDGRRMFAQHFFVKADAYFHSGYYPTVFDNREAFQTPHMAADAGAVGEHNQGDETGFLGRPRDWIDRLSRQLFPAVHTHLDEGGAEGRAQLKELGEGAEVREILPWLRLSAELDPQRVETYTVTAYWLRQRMGQVDEAEKFLRDGLRANPSSYEILYELGRVCDENRHDALRARSLWQAALGQWQKQQGDKPDADKFLLVEIVSHLATLEKRQGDYEPARAHMELWKKYSPRPEEVEKRIEELRQEMSAKPKSTASND